MLRAMRAAVHHAAAGLDAVADDLAAAVIAHRRDRMNRALEAVERPRPAVRGNLEGLVVVVAAHVALRHINSSLSKPGATLRLRPPSALPGARRLPRCGATAGRPLGPGGSPCRGAALRS